MKKIILITILLLVIISGCTNDNSEVNKEDIINNETELKGQEMIKAVEQEIKEDIPIVKKGTVIDIKELSDAEVVKRIIGSNNISRYNLIMYSKQYMIFDDNEESSEMTIQVTYEGYVDRDNKEISLESKVGEDIFHKIEIKEGEMKMTIDGKTQTMQLNEDLWRQWSPLDYTIAAISFPGFIYLPDDNGNYVLISNITDTGISSADKIIRESGINENYIKIWVDKKDMRITKTLFHLDMKSEDFSQVMDIESIITQSS